MPQVTPFEYTLFDYAGISSKKISSHFYSYLNVNNPVLWAESVIFNDVVTFGIEIDEFHTRDVITFAFPNPFRYGKNIVEMLRIPSPIDETLMADVNIYTASMDLVYSANQRVEKFGNSSIVNWNGRTNNNEKLASGIYIYVIKVGEKVNKGKLVIFNE